MVSFDGEKGEATTWLEREYSTTNAVFSPGGRYVALVSRQTGQEENLYSPVSGPGRSDTGVGRG